MDQTIIITSFKILATEFLLLIPIIAFMLYASDCLKRKYEIIGVKILLLDLVVIFFTVLFIIWSN